MFSLSSIIYLDTHLKEYFRILSVNKPPPGPLGQYITKINQNRLSPFESFTNDKSCCIYAIKHLPNNGSTQCNKHQSFMTIDDLDILIDFLVENNYDVNTRLSKLIQKNPRLNKKDDFIFYVSYSP